ncbi:hypothetical protein DB347_10790 [Opitutaceae bacterium EW11]|nr:hypothetical protein DB347_10790 [Opitutaceae bacterium EW11]
MRVLNYLELSVYQPNEEGSQPERRIATVLALGRDLFDSLEKAVFELKRSGWVVDDLRLFKTDVAYEQFSTRERLRRSYDRARAEGIDWFIEPEPVLDRAGVA